MQYKILLSVKLQGKTTTQLGKWLLNKMIWQVFGSGYTPRASEFSKGYGNQVNGSVE